MPFRSSHRLFGSEGRIRRRPVLLAVVFGGFLVIVGITATSQAGVVSADLTSTALEAVVGSDATTVRNLANLTLLRSDVTEPGPSPARVVQLQSALETLIQRGEIVHADIRTPDGTVIASDQAAAVGRRIVPDADFRKALTNDPAIAIIPTEAAGFPTGAAGSPALDPGSPAGDAGTPQILREHLPLSVDGQVKAVVTVYRDAVPMLERIDAARRDVVTVTISAALIAGILLFLIFRAASARLTRQTEQD